jgi:hypothetical protein
MSMGTLRTLQVVCFFSMIGAALAALGGDTAWWARVVCGLIAVGCAKFGMALWRAEKFRESWGE